MNDAARLLLLIVCLAAVIVGVLALVYWLGGGLWISGRKWL